MPFTFAHPAAVLWGARWHQTGLPFSAFVIGSMSPDFEYFLRLRLLSFYSHSMVGILTFCLPVGLMVYGLHRWVIAPALYRNLPCAVRERITESPCNGVLLRRVLQISIAIMIGAATHILWDGFSHGNGYFVLGSGALVSKVMGVPVYKFLQHGSTLLGFGIMILWFHRQPRARAFCTNDHDRWYWPAFAVTWCLAMVGLHQIQSDIALGALIVQGIVALFIALLVVGILFRGGAGAPADGCRPE